MYVCGCTVIWSKGYGTHKTVCKCMTVNSEIKNVVWCTFGTKLTTEKCADKQGIYIYTYYLNKNNILNVRIDSVQR